MRQQEVAEWKANPVIHPKKFMLDAANFQQYIYNVHQRGGIGRLRVTRPFGLPPNRRDSRRLFGHFLF